MKFSKFIVYFVGMILSVRKRINHGCSKIKEKPRVFKKKRKTVGVHRK